MYGQIKFFNLQKDYGFISPENRSPDVFFRSSGFYPGTPWPEPGDRVQYEVIDRQAVRIMKCP